MTNNMTNDYAQKRNAQLFRRQMTVLYQAAIGVIQVRTNEPFRAIDALRDMAFADGMDFKTWTILRGWQTYDRARQADEPVCDNVTEPLSALKAITGLGSQDGGFPGKGIYVMMNPHKILTQHIAMIQCIKEYARNFPNGYRRLILVTPSGYVLPEELQGDVIIVDFDPPSFAELKENLTQLIQDTPEAKRPRYSNEQIEQIVNNGAGMTKQEFENAVSRAMVTKRELLPNIPIEDFTKIVGGVKTEVVKRSEVLELMEPDDIANIGGLDNLKDWIRKRARVFSQEARDFGVEPPKGIALIGPPGTGKTASGKAIASVLGIPMLKLDVGRIFQALVGQSEQRVREATKLVDTMAPCVLLIDEADKAFQVSSGGDSGVGQRVLGTLLTWMQETKSPVFMIVTANRTENLPSEFLRRGRLDEIFNVTVPNEEERLEIIKIHLRKRKQNPDAVPNLEKAVEDSAGYVSSELESAVKDALIEAYTQGVAVTGELIAQQLSYMVPLSEAFREQFDNMARWAENNARPASRKAGETSSQPRIRKRVSGATPSHMLASGPRATNLDS